jgi:hypothetical protein
VTTELQETCQFGNDLILEMQVARKTPILSDRGLNDLLFPSATDWFAVVSTPAGSSSFPRHGRAGYRVADLLGR